MPWVPNVTVVVPAYNSEYTIRDCINSLLDLNYPKENLELIIVNNASTDKTSVVLKQYSNDIRILYEAKRGPAAARNKGILNAKGEVVAFTDSDCVVEKNWLLHLIQPLRNCRVGIVGGMILSKLPHNAIEGFGEFIHDHNKAINEYKPPYAITMNWTSRLCVLKEMNFFDESFIRCEDVDLSYRILQSGYRLAFQPEAIVRHRNESTYAGLFGEGILHGFHSVLAGKKHRDFVSSFYRKRSRRGSYIAIASSLMRYLRGKEPDHSICYFVFNSGKKIGKICGSIRWFCLDL